ncbi:hypothetical protein KSP39_PZI000386 [Platanthera zijinensis]|uniref:F-box/LRR-repeat protein n=1 Tax=Platanthera zijinensis TaxID=2320716 RepID=A0AAP0GFE9_9ASPA
MGKPRITTWEDLHLDCVFIIFSKLGLDDLTAVIPFVCKSWFQASSHPSLHKILDFTLLDLNSSSPLSKILSSQYSLHRFTFSGFLKLAMALSNGAADELRFSALFPPSIEVLSTASAACPSLKTLFLPRINFDDEARFLDLIPNWSDLECLEMESKPSNLGEMVKQIGANCGRFRGLKIRGSIDNADAQGIVNFLPKIESLDLSGSRMRREEALAILDGCRELKRFTVRDCVGFEVDDELQRRAAGIELFEFEGCRAEEKFRNFINHTEDLDYMLMHYGDCFELWML